MQEKIIGTIPYVSFKDYPKSNFSLLFAETFMFLADEMEMDKFSLNAPIGMWPASGAVIDSLSPSVKLTDFTKKTEKIKNNMKVDLETVKNKSRVLIMYNEIKTIQIKENEDYADLLIDADKKFDFVIYYIDYDLVYEYNNMLEDIFESRLIQNYKN